MAALYNHPLGLLNPAAPVEAKPEGLYKDSPVITDEMRAQGRAAVEEYNTQNPGPLSAWANKRAERQSQDERYAPIPEEPVDYTQEGVLFAQEGQPAEGEEVPSADPVVDPATSLAISTKNRGITGGGLGDRSAPQVPGAPETPQQAAFQAQELESKRIAFDQNKIPKWHESNAFGMGLISFGLNMMSGNNAAESFNAAGKVFEDGYSKEKREAWADELRSQGYDDNEIMRWIDTGDNKDLTDPNEKKMKNMEYQRAQYGLEEARYNTNEGRTAKANQQKFENEMAVTKYKADQDYRNASLDLQERGFALKVAEQERKAKGEATPKMTARDYGQLAQTVMPTVKVANQRIAFSDAAKRDLDDIKRYIKEGNTAGIQGSYKSFQYNMARAAKGGGATLTSKDVEEATALTSSVDNVLNLGSLKATGKPTPTWVDTMEKSVVNDITNQTNGVRSIAEQTYNTYAPVFGHEEAERAVGRIFGGGSMGALKFDPRTGSLISDDRVDRVGPGTVTIKR
ncbi:MAG: hypothetical protein ACRC6V_13375 [Bacteroidales bacterium]